MRYRRLSAGDLDMTFGHGVSDYIIDQPETVAQAAMTRLRLLLGEWFLDTDDGTAWKTRVLGNRTRATRDPEIRARILGTPGVTGLAAYSSVTDADTRLFTVTATIDTIYGQAALAVTL